MNNNEFKEYLDEFEKRIIVQGIEKSKFGKSMMIPIKKGKLDNTDFGQVLGTQFNCEKPIAIDYYGLLKKSSGLIDKFSEFSEMQVRAIKAPIVHFASIKVEYISDLSQELVKDFPKFKKKLISLRGFKKKSGDNKGKNEAIA